jgi:protein-S-isoprenylcysteine O-methyltransferase Ste14
MSDSNPAQTDHPEPSLVRLGIAHFFQVVVLFAILGGILFLSAGRLDWWDAWVFLVVYFAIALVSGWLMLRNDPELLKERSQAITKKNVKAWDRVMVALNWLLSLALFAVIGLDAGRWGWSAAPFGVRFLGGLGIVLSFGLTLWAARVNTYMSAMVRIQDERGHRAVTIGPYRYIRHPMYVGMCLYDIGLPWLLGSWWGLVVSGLMIAVVVVRTALEDRTLRRELPGYAEYARQVRYRLLPGVW